MPWQKCVVYQYYSLILTDISDTMYMYIYTCVLLTLHGLRKCEENHCWIVSVTCKHVKYVVWSERLFSLSRNHLQMQNRPQREVVQLQKAVNTFKPIARHEHEVCHLFVYYCLWIRYLHVFIILGVLVYRWSHYISK